jgi:hypothetical protein
MTQHDLMWTTFAAVTRGAAAGLTGLTFIVVAFRFDTLAVNSEHRSRASQTLSLFLTILIIGTLITVPQPLFALGMMIAAGACATLHAFLSATARRTQTASMPISYTVGLILFVVSIGMCGMLLIVFREM